MKKFFKKIFLNGLIRSVLALFYAILFKIQSFKISDSSLNTKKFDLIENNFSSNSAPLSYRNDNDTTSSNEDDDEEIISNKNSLIKESENFDESNLSDHESSFRNGLNKVNQNIHEYKNEYNQSIRLDTKFLKSIEHVSISKTTRSKSNFVLNFFKSKNFNTKRVVICICVILTYVSLNNFLIYSSYDKSTESESFESVSFFRSNEDSFNDSYQKSLFFSFNSILSNFKQFVSVFLYDITDVTQKYDSNITNSSFKILIDPHDLDVASLVLDKNDAKRILLTDQYFDEEENDHFNEKKIRPCVLAKLNPYDKEIMQFVQKENSLKCNPKQNWIYIENGKNEFKFTLNI